MIALIQRVAQGSVVVDDSIVGKIGQGFVAFVGICRDDEPTDAIKLAEKVAGLRIFNDSDNKMNLSILDCGGEILAVSQFTLCADTTKGKRPSFDRAMHTDRADELFTAFIELLKAKGLKVETGVFGAHMIVNITNDGPVTIWLDSKAKRKKSP